MLGGKKIKRPLKKRFKEDDEYNSFKNKDKHRDKIAWRLLRSEQREKNMKNSYQKFLRQQIQELEIHIEQSSEKKEQLQIELNKLKIAEFEEDMREDSNQQLLKG